MITKMKTTILHLEAENAQLQEDLADSEARCKNRDKWLISSRAELAQLEAVIQRMIPKLRESFTDEYIQHELIQESE